MHIQKIKGFDIKGGRGSSGQVSTQVWSDWI